MLYPGGLLGSALPQGPQKTQLHPLSSHPIPSRFPASPPIPVGWGSGQLPFTFPSPEFRTSCSHETNIRCLAPVLLCAATSSCHLCLPSSAGPRQEGKSLSIHIISLLALLLSTCGLSLGTDISWPALLGRSAALCWNITGLCWLALCLRTLVGIKAGAITS